MKRPRLSVVAPSRGLTPATGGVLMAKATRSLSTIIVEVSIALALVAVIATIMGRVL